MKNVQDALASLRRTSGLAKLDFNQHGAVEIIFDKTISINIVRIDETTLEFVTYLHPARFAVDVTPMRALLHANYLGSATGHGRFALDPRDDELLYCERVDVSPLDDRQLEKRLLDFVKHATFWRSPEAERLLASAGDAPSTLAPTEFVIRG